MRRSFRRWDCLRLNDIRPGSRRAHNGERPCGLEGGKHAGVSEVLAKPGRLTQPVVIRGARHRQPVAPSDRRRRLTPFLSVIGVIDLNPEQTQICPPPDLMRGNDPPLAIEGTRVGEHRNSPGLAYGRDDVGGVRRPVAHIVGRGGGENGGEDLVAVAKAPQLDEGIGDVGPPERGAGTRLGHNLLEGEGKVPGDARNHRHDPFLASRVNLAKEIGEGRVGRIVKIRQHVDGNAVPGARDLTPAHERHARRLDGSLGLGPSRRRVVVGQPDDVETRPPGRLHELGGRIRAIGARGVSVGVDTRQRHGAQPSAVHAGRVCGSVGGHDDRQERQTMSNDISLSGNTGRDNQPLSDRGNNRSRRAGSKAFREFIGKGWAPRTTAAPSTSGAAPYLAQRHLRLGKAFLGQRLVIPAGTYKVRSNDTDYRFRAHSAFAHLTGLGGELEPDAVLVLEPLTDAEGTTLPGRHRESEETHRGVLFFKPQAPRSSEEFYADSRYGEFWVGPRYTLDDMEAATGLEVADIAQLPDQLAKDAGQVDLRVIRNVDVAVESQVNEVRSAAGLAAGEDARTSDEALEERASTIRLTKDAWEVSELEHAVAITKSGFEEIIAALPRAVDHHRGERVIEGAFGARAREDGNGLGYDTIAAAGNHANTLHWIDNDGKVCPGDLVLVDAGVEADSLYTADITRTLPVDGTFTDVQREVYEAVLEACEAGLAKANEPGAKFRDVHDAAVAVLVTHLDRWGVLPCSVEEALSEEGQQFRRWMPHGVSHHLGLDVHDCAQAARELYLDAELEPGMCFTIEPGLYFHADDELLPERLRGMGVRIEDDIVIDADGSARRMSEDIPRTVADVEAWIAEVQSR